MSKSKWAGIVYGRSYYLDFRLIAMPQDFMPEDSNWALQHILPTTRAPEKLVFQPRWSLFKNERYFIVGVTCMVRDLISQSDLDTVDNLTKDAQGRPLYIFVGYGTKVRSRSSFGQGLSPFHLLSFPPYVGENLELFQPLYQYVQQRWQVKQYDTSQKKPVLTEYQDLAFDSDSALAEVDRKISLKLNAQTRQPNKIFLWQNSEQWRRKLWTATAKFSQPTSLCVGSASQQDLIQSPFLNGTADDVAKFSVHARTDLQGQKTLSCESMPKHQPLTRSLPQMIEDKARKDIELTFQQAEQAVVSGQEFMQNLIGTNKSDYTSDESQSKKITKSNNFGFKQKKSTEESQDWF